MIVVLLHVRRYAFLARKGAMDLHPFNERHYMQCVTLTLSYPPCPWLPRAGHGPATVQRVLPPQHSVVYLLYAFVS